MRRKVSTRLLALLVTVALTFTILPTAFAADYVATDGTTNYESLQAAIDAAGTTKTTITLLDNIDLDKGTITVAAGQDITIDFAGHRISGEVTANLTASHYMIHNSGTLTLKCSVGTGGATLVYTGESTNFRCTADTICNDVGGNLTVESGVYYNNTNVDDQISYVLDCYTGGNTETTTTVIDGGTFVSPYYLCVRVFANGKAMNSLTINDGNFTGRITLQDPSSAANKGELKIKGGEFNANDCTADVVFLHGQTDSSGLSASIEGGTFNGNVYFSSYYTGETSPDQTFKAEISGGTYNEAVWSCTWRYDSTEGEYYDAPVKAIKGGDFFYSEADYLDPSVPVELYDGGRYSYYPTVDEAKAAASSSSASITVIPEDYYYDCEGYTVTLNDRGDTVNYAGVTSFTLPTLTSSATYIFNGWRDEDGTLYAGGETCDVDDDVEFTADWTVLSIVYELKTEAGNGGSVKANFTYAGAGNKAVITVTPDAGYELDSITAVDAKGNAVALTLADGNYTFTMPASKVTVSATFVSTGDVLDEYDDVDGDHEYADALRYCVENGILVGDGNGKLMPDGELDRGQTVVIIWRLAGSPISEAENTFTDVDEDDWYADAVVWAAEKGITLGNGNDQFMPDASVTLEQFACFLARYSVLAGQSVESDLSCLEDIEDADSISAWAQTEVAWALDNGLIKADEEGKLCASEPASRGRIADVLWNYLED